MSTVYECVICHNLNHVSRTHCAVCGTTPVGYSVFGFAYVWSTYHVSIPIVSARGAERQGEHKERRLGLKTVTPDYYAES